MSKLSISAFTGMNDLAGGFNNREQVATPERIVDAIPSLDGSLDVRPGYGKVIDLEKCSNLWKSPGSGKSYAVSGDWLCRVDLDLLSATHILQVTENSDKVYFVNAGSIDFCGNSYFLAAIENGVARVMGQSINDLQAMNWQETENGQVLFLKDASGMETAHPHPGEFAHAPEPMDFLCYGHGRLWGARGKKGFYSYPGLLEWWEDEANNFEFPTKPTMICAVSGGIFFGLEDQVVFFSGRDPLEMEPKTVSWTGAVKNSLVIAPKISEMPAETPTWMNTDGNCVAGMPDGSLVELTKERVKATPASNCAAGVIKINGVQTLLYRIEE